MLSLLWRYGKDAIQQERPDRVLARCDDGGPTVRLAVVRTDGSRHALQYIFRWVSHSLNATELVTLGFRRLPFVLLPPSLRIRLLLLLPSMSRCLPLIFRLQLESAQFLLPFVLFPVELCKRHWPPLRAKAPDALA